MKPLGYVLSGAIILGFGIIALFFWRFWRDTRDRLFLFFSSAFWILALERVAVLYLGHNQENGPVVYLARVLAFSMIACAIVQKNR